MWACTTYPKLTFKVKGFKFALCDERLAEILRRKKEQKADQPSKSCASDFAATTVTPARMQQALHEVGDAQSIPPELGAFVKWLADDVIQEEAGLRQELGLDEKAVRKAVGQLAIPWFKERHPLKLITTPGAVRGQ